MSELDVNESEAITETESNEPESVESNEPESMLEAIQDGLKSEEEVAEDDVEKEEEKEPVVAEDAQPENEDEPPEGISKKAQERFRKLTTRLKERESEFERVNSDLGSIRKMMQETGGKPEDFAKTFEYIRALNKGDLNGARSILEDQIKQLTILTGKPFSDVDPLSNHPDLRERVNAYQMDEQTAFEMAKHRSFQQAQNNQQMQYEQQQRSQYESTKIKQHAINEIDRMGAEWAKTDPDYSFKEGLITAKAQMITQQFPPSQWATQVKLMYDTISSMPMQRKPSNSPAPLRSSGQSAGQRQPNSMLEALQNGLGYTG